MLIERTFYVILELDNCVHYVSWLSWVAMSGNRCCSIGPDGDTCTGRYVTSLAATDAGFWSSNGIASFSLRDTNIGG